MKKILIVFLVIDILLLLCYCTITNEKSETPATSKGEETTSPVVTTTASTTKQPLVTTLMTTAAKDTTTDTTPEEKPSSGYFASYQSILELCRMAVESLDYVNQNPNGLADQLFGFEDSTEKEWFLALYSSLTIFYPGRGKEDHNSPHYKLSLGYDYKDLNGDGIDELVLLTDEFIVIAIFSMAEGKPVLLANYWERHRAWIDENGWIHHNGSSGADYSNNIVYKVAAGGASLEVIAGFGTNGAEWVGEEAVTIYYKLVNGEKVRIPKDEHDSLEKYFGEYLGWDATKQATKEKAGLSFKTLFDYDEINEEVMDAALNNEIKVTYARHGEEAQSIYLKDYVFSEGGGSLGEFSSNSYAMINMDGYGICELVIDSYHYIVLHYEGGKVYLYEFSDKQMHTVFTDGTICGHSEAGRVVSGYKLSFDGTAVTWQKRWETVYDQENDSQSYYIEGEQVSEDAYNRYFENKPTIRVEFIPEEQWKNRISHAEALVIAKEFWQRFEPEKNQYVISIGYDSKAPSNVYDVHLQWWVMDNQLSTIENVWINKITGEVRYPHDIDLTSLSYRERRLWEDDLVTLLSGLEPYDPDAVSISTYAVGLFDLNFDNTPEVVVIYPGGSMGNMWVKIYDLKQPNEPICDYSGMSVGEKYLTVAKMGDEYVVLAEGSIRGRSYRLDLLTFDSGVVETKELFGVGDSSNDPNYYFYMGERVEKSKYDEEYQKFLNDYTVFAETEISLVFWKDYDFSNPKQLVRDIAEDLLYSSQTFIDYKN